MFFLYFAYNIKIAVMKWLAQKTHKPNISGMFWKIVVMIFAVMKFASGEDPLCKKGPNSGLYKKDFVKK